MVLACLVFGFGLGWSLRGYVAAHEAFVAFQRKLAEEARGTRDDELARWKRRGGKIVPFRRPVPGPYARRSS